MVRPVPNRSAENRRRYKAKKRLIGSMHLHAGIDRGKHRRLLFRHGSGPERCCRLPRALKDYLEPGSCIGREDQPNANGDQLDGLQFPRYLCAMFVFIVPLKSRACSGDWATVSALCRQTISSMLAAEQA